MTKEKENNKLKSVLAKKKNKTISLALSYDDVLLVPQHSEIESRQDVDLKTQITPHITLKIPLISVNMTDVTGVKMAVAIGKLGGIGFLPRFNTIDEEADMVRQVKKAGVKVGAAIGIRDGELERAEALVKSEADIITVDVAHGAMQKAIETTKILKKLYGNKVDIVSGVVATYDGAYDLFKAGADAVRVGVGPGTICTTRITTGVGVPQITALLEASKAARKFKKTILCDGGTKNPGDIVKGLAAGASAVVIGSQFAGCEEAEGKLVIKDGKKYKTYNASTSLAEKTKHTKKIKTSPYYLKHIEGVESLVPYRGHLEDVISYFEASLRAGFSYVGAKNIKELWEKAEFVQITPQGQRESSFHDVIPNFND